MKNTSSNPSSPLSQDQNDSHSVNSSSNTNPSSEVGSRAGKCFNLYVCRLNSSSNNQEKVEKIF